MRLFKLTGCLVGLAACAVTTRDASGTLDERDILEARERTREELSELRELRPMPTLPGIEVIHTSECDSDESCMNEYVRLVRATRRLGECSFERSMLIYALQFDARRLIALPEAAFLGDCVSRHERLNRIDAAARGL